MGTYLSKEFRFDSAHRLFEYHGKCANIHGHTYVAKISMGVHVYPESMMGLDFKIISALIGGWIDENWDHRILLNSVDPVCSLLKEAVLMFEFEGNPTAENMVGVLFHESVRLLSEYPIKVKSVEIYETPTCSAIYVSDK